MRTIEEVKKEQTQVLYDLGFHMARVDQLRDLIRKLADEAALIHQSTQDQ